MKEYQQEPCRTIYRRAKANVITMPVYLNEICSKTEKRNRKMECKESNRNKEKYVHYMVKHSCGLVRDLLSVLSDSNFTVNAQPPSPSNWFGNETEPLIPNSNESVFKTLFIFLLIVLFFE